MSRWRSLMHISARALIDARRTPLHTGLILAASVAGTASVIVSDASTRAGSRKLEALFDAQGTDVITVVPLQSRAVGGRVRTGALVPTLTMADYRALRVLPGIIAGSPLVSRNLRLRAGPLTKAVEVVGCSPEYFAIKRQPLRSGSWPREGSRGALLGAGAARDLFGASDPTDQRLSINRIPFVVAGVLADRGQRLDVANENDQVFVPVQTAMRRLMNVDSLSGLVLQAGDKNSLAPLAEAVRARLSTRHRRVDRGRDDFQVGTQTALIGAQSASVSRLGFFTRWVGLSAAAVSVFAVAGLCWLAINARTHEIGVRRALGARRRDVATEFGVATVVAALAGGMVAVPAGTVAARWVEDLLGQPLFFSWPSAVTVAGTFTSVFCVAIVALSLRAARVHPSEALQSG